MTEFRCKQCGNCCKSVEYIAIEDEDIQRWKKAGRQDLCTPDMLIEWDYFGASGLYDNQDTMDCPFLKKNQTKYYCELHEDNLKPNVCREFPLDRADAKESIDCPGFD